MEYTFFPAAYSTASKIYQIIGYKSNSNKKIVNKQREIISCILSVHNEIKAEINIENSEYTNICSLMKKFIHSSYIYLKAEVSYSCHSQIRYYS